MDETLGCTFCQFQCRFDAFDHELDEQSHFRSLVALVWKHDGQACARRRSLFANRYQLSRSQLIDDIENGLVDDTTPFDGPFCQHIPIVTTDRPCDGEGLRAVCGLQGPAEFGRSGESKQQAIVIVVDKICPM